MSEYQYYEWQTVDRLLTEAEQAAVNNLSSHIEVSSSRAVVTYVYGDFKHDPRTVLARFFDAHLYLANWGSRRLLFRFPSGLVGRVAIEPYCVPDRITFGTVGGFDVLDMDLSEEEGGNWIEAEMKALADREADVWREVAERVGIKQAKGYEDAVLLLKKLAQVAEFQGSQDDFRERVTALCDRYKRLSGFTSRVQKAKPVG